MLMRLRLASTFRRRAGAPLHALWLLALVSLMPVSAAQASAAAWAALEEPGTVALMRHALAPGTGDPADFALDDCTTQRNLDERGRAQARAIGAAFRARGIAVDRVLTSQWCRCRETAELLDLGPVEDLPALNSFFQNRAAGPEQTRATRAFLREAAGTARLMLVTHQVNITALTGVFPASGEVVVGRMGADGFEVLGSIEIGP